MPYEPLPASGLLSSLFTFLKDWRGFLSADTQTSNCTVMLDQNTCAAIGKDDGRGYPGIKARIATMITNSIHRKSASGGLRNAAMNEEAKQSTPMPNRIRRYNSFRSSDGDSGDDMCDEEWAPGIHIV